MRASACLVVNLEWPYSVMESKKTSTLFCVTRFFIPSFVEEIIVSRKTQCFDLFGRELTFYFCWPANDQTARRKARALRHERPCAHDALLANHGPVHHDAS